MLLFRKEIIEMKLMAEDLKEQKGEQILSCIDSLIVTMIPSLTAHFGGHCFDLIYRKGKLQYH